jgi:hypothetical protein
MRRQLPLWQQLPFERDTDAKWNRMQVSDLNLIIVEAKPP